MSILTFLKILTIISLFFNFESKIIGSEGSLGGDVMVQGGEALQKLAEKLKILFKDRPSLSFIHSFFPHLIILYCLYHCPPLSLFSFCA